MANQFAEQFKTAMPKVNVNRNGYEIRAEVLDMAKQFTEFEYSAKVHGFEVSSRRDGKDLVTNVAMPDVPGVDKVLETAEKFYNFVNNTYNK